MKKNILKIAFLIVAANTAALSTFQAFADDPRLQFPNPKTVELKYPSYVEAGGSYYNVSNNFGDWSGGYIKSSVVTGKKNIWHYELDYDRRFNDNGVYGSIGNTHFWNEDWYTSVSAGTSSGGFFNPAFRADGFVYKRWLDNKSLVTNIGYGYYKAEDIYTNNTISIGASYYFEAPFIVEGGVRLNWSDPGANFGPSQYASVTYGMNKKQFITARYEHANETYQLVGSNTAIVDFDSNQYSLIWRQWFNNRWGMNVRGEYYENPNYDRTGGTVGIFREF